MMSGRSSSVVLLFALSLSAIGQDTPPAFRDVRPLVEAAIAAGDLPGAVVCFADSSDIRYLETFGNRQVEPTQIEMTADTVFDLASITKPVATATSIAVLVGRGDVDYSARVSQYLPEFTGNKKDTITVAQCLLHTSGLTPDNALSDYNDGPEAAWERICDLGLRSEPGEKFAYSDVGFIVLGKIVERVGGEPLDRFASQNVFGPMQMTETTFNPPERLRRRAAPTEKQGERFLQGEVHDPRSSRMGGVAGHAGLFSTAADLVTYGRHLLKAARGEDDTLSAETFAAMTRPHNVPRGTRTYGWDHRSPYSRNRGESLSDAAFGHGGFTGTVLWIDPEKDLIFVFLSSRLHPDGKGSVNTLAGEIVTSVGTAW